MLHRSDGRPAGLRRFARERFGLDTYLLHDGGLGLGRTHGTLALEERPRVTKLARQHRDLDPEALIDLRLPIYPIADLPLPGPDARARRIRPV